MVQKHKDVPEIGTAGSLRGFLSESLSLFKAIISPEALRQKVQQIGFASRVSFQQTLRGKRRFPPTKIDGLAEAFDLTHAERKAAWRLAQADQGEATGASRYVLGTEDILGDPVYTIALNLCGCRHKLTVAEVIARLESLSLCSGEQARAILEKLLDEGVLIENADRKLERNLNGQQLSPPPGVKLDYARAYFQKSLQFTKCSYELPLDRRELAAFTARIRSEDFAKLKDLIRNFRRAVYDLSPPEECDTVVQVTLGAFIVTSIEAESSIDQSSI